MFSEAPCQRHENKRLSKIKSIDEPIYVNTEVKYSFPHLCAAVHLSKNTQGGSGKHSLEVILILSVMSLNFEATCTCSRMFSRGTKIQDTVRFKPPDKTQSETNIQQFSAAPSLRRTALSSSGFPVFFYQ